MPHGNNYYTNKAKPYPVTALDLDDTVNYLNTVGTETRAATKGGTGHASYVVGDVIYADTTTTLATLAAGASTTYLSGGTNPSWVTLNQAAVADLTASDTPTFDQVTTTTRLNTDTIAERTADAGVTVDGVLLKDQRVNALEVITDTISEKNSDAGVTIDSVLIKDGGLTTTNDIAMGSLKTVDGRDVSVDGTQMDANTTKLSGIEGGATADQTKADINGLAITEVGTIDTGVWQGDVIDSAYINFTGKYQFIVEMPSVDGGAIALGAAGYNYVLNTGEYALGVFLAPLTGNIKITLVAWSAITTNIQLDTAYTISSEGDNVTTDPVSGTYDPDEAYTANILKATQLYASIAVVTGDFVKISLQNDDANSFAVSMFYAEYV